MLEKIKQVISAESGFAPDEICDGDTLRSLVRDSLELTQLVLELENSLGIEITDDDLKSLVTVGDVARFAEAH